MAKNTPIDEPEEEEITLDMTTAKVLEPIPADRPYLMACSKWKPGRTANGRKLDYELTVVEPSDFANRKISESVSLENEYTLGRFQTLCIALGIPEDEAKSKTFKLPKEEDMIGLQATIWVGIRKSDTYGDRNNIRRMRPASAYKEVAAV